MASAELDLSTARWHRSSYSNSSGGECVEVATDHPTHTPVRDSKATHTGGPVLLFRAPAWSAFVAEIKR
ncbi:DUF397 domain-containing protein [Streptomyces sp. R21]|uniref:DUF397 domain-containing protein n=1 Tax=Streptomyces sp. R21 TaxID=3238627 RepID=A0AB39PBS8_9ACTN